jgi:hypothetical protein
MESSATLLWSLVFGSIGLGYLMYGKKQKKLMPFVVGVLLIALPYSISNPLMIVVSGTMLMAMPYFMQL